MRSAWMALILAAAAPRAWAQQVSAADPHEGERLFRQHCGICHVKPRIDAGQFGPVLSRATVDGKEAAVHDFIAQGTPRMPGFRYQFSAAQLDAVVQYLKTVPDPTQPASSAPGKRAGSGGGMGAD